MTTSSDPARTERAERPRVLVTRPAEDAGAFARALEDAGFLPVLEPMLTIQPANVDPDALAADLADVQALLFTSANGVRAFSHHSRYRDLPALCVGEATAAAARLAGLETVHTAEGDVEALASLAEDILDPEAGALFHAAGSVTAGDLQGRLGAHGFVVRKRALYAAEPTGELSTATRTAMANREIAAATFFSPRTAESFVRVVEDAGVRDACSHLTAACLSQAVAEKASALPWERTVVAETPNAAALIEVLDRALNGRQGVRVQDPATGDADRNEGDRGADMSDPQKDETTASTETGKGTEEGAHAHMTPDADAVIEAFGGIRPMANRLDVAVSTVQGWKTRQHIPDNRWRDIIAAADAAGVDLAALAGASASDTTEGKQEKPDAAEADESSRTAGEAPDSPKPGAPTGSVPRSSAAKGKETAKKAKSADRPAPRRAPQKRHKGGGPAWLALVVGIVAVAGIATEPYWRQQADAVLDPLMARAFPALKKAEVPRIDPARIESLAADIGDLGARIDRLAGDIAGSESVSPEALSALAERVDALEEKLATPSAATMDEATETAGAPALADLRGRIESMGSQLDGLATRAALDALRDRTATIEQRLESQATRMDEIAKAPALKGAREAAVVIAVGAVQDAIAAGRPFAEPLSRVSALAAQDPALAEAVANLEPLAGEGVISRDQLLRRFNAAAPQMQSAPAEDANMLEETLGRLTSLVSVRETGEGADKPPVSRAEAALARGDLAGAVAALSPLAGQNAAVDRWLAAAEARLTAESAVDALRAAATERLTGATEG